MKNKIRTGIGYDTHPLVSGRRLVIGGVEVPFEKGADGWSDADVLLHAIIDALLGAAGMGDIGQLFPPGDERYRNISSLALLQEVRHRLERAGWTLGNLDATVITERPRLQDYLGEVRDKISRALGTEIEKVSIKAKTANGLGFIGRGDGIAACAVVLIEGGQDENI